MVDPEAQLQYFEDLIINREIAISRNHPKDHVGKLSLKVDNMRRLLLSEINDMKRWTSALERQLKEEGVDLEDIIE